MRYSAGLIFLGFSKFAYAETKMDDTQLTLSVECPGNPQCIFSGKNIPIVIKVKNNSAQVIDFAGHFVRKTGPRIRLIDRLTGKYLNLRTSLAPHSLLESFEPISPGEMFEFSEYIPASKIRYFRDQYIDLAVEVGITSNVRQLGKDAVQYRAHTKFTILGEDTHATEGLSEAPSLQR
jgi:hypothetical protein